MRNAKKDPIWKARTEVYAWLERESGSVASQTATFAPMVDDKLKEHELSVADIQRNRIVEMYLGAHPNFPRLKTIEMEYAIRDSGLTTNVRAAIASYVVRRWNLDCTKEYKPNLASRILFWLRAAKK